jgi:hypothetical protein
VELQFTAKGMSKYLFDHLKQEQTAIENEVGEKLDWLRQDEYITSRVAISTKTFIVSDRDQWPQQFAWLFGYLLKFKATFQDRVKAIANSSPTAGTETTL